MFYDNDDLEIIDHDLKTGIENVGSFRVSQLIASARDRNRLDGLINAPETEDFDKAVPLEAAHQIERWGADDRTKKSDLDWLWLINYLGGGAAFGNKDAARKYADWCRDLANATMALTGRGADGDHEKYQHRIIATAAAIRNWFLNRWPGKEPKIEEPKDDLSLERTVEAASKAALVRALKAARGDVRKAAELLGITRYTVYRMIKRFGLTGRRGYRNWMEVRDAI